MIAPPPGVRVLVWSEPVDLSEPVDFRRGMLRGRAIVRPKYGCRSCVEAVVQAPAPDSLIPGGLPIEALLAHIAVAMHQDGQPLHRQCRIFARDGVTLDRQTAADWMGRTAWWLSPLWKRLVADVLASPKLFVDDTDLPVLDKRTASAKAKGKNAARTGFLWGLGRDDAAWQGERPPAVACIFTPDRVHARAVEMLAGYTGILRVDGWGGFQRLIGKEEAGKADVGAVTGRTGGRRVLHRRSTQWRVASRQVGGCAEPGVPPRWAGVRRKRGGDRPPSHTESRGPADGVRPPGPARASRPNDDCTDCGRRRKGGGTADRPPLWHAHGPQRPPDRRQRKPGRRQGQPGATKAAIWTREQMLWRENRSLYVLNLAPICIGNADGPVFNRH